MVREMPAIKRRARRGRSSQVKRTIKGKMATVGNLGKVTETKAAALAGLRRSFDERLSVLQGRSATTRLQATIRGHAKLRGKVKSGSGY
jgi:hypothetical protein